MKQDQRNEPPYNWNGPRRPRALTRRKCYCHGKRCDSKLLLTSTTTNPLHSSKPSKSAQDKHY